MDDQSAQLRELNPVIVRIALITKALKTQYGARLDCNAIANYHFIMNYRVRMDNNVVAYYAFTDRYICGSMKVSSDNGFRMD